MPLISAAAMVEYTVMDLELVGPEHGRWLANPSPSPNPHGLTPIKYSLH